MTSSAETRQIRELIADALGLELDEVPADATMNTVSAWDSLQHLGVITALESELGWQLTAEEIPTLSSVAAILARMQKEPT